jgi:hypothetical protein
VTLQTPLKTVEGEETMEMTAIPLIAAPSTVSGTMTFAHKITPDSPLKHITSAKLLEQVEDGGMIFSVAFSAIDATYHQEIVSAKK